MNHTFKMQINNNYWNVVGETKKVYQQHICFNNFFLWVDFKDAGKFNYGINDLQVNEVNSGKWNNRKLGELLGQNIIYNEKRNHNLS